MVTQKRGFISLYLLYEDVEQDLRCECWVLDRELYQDSRAAVLSELSSQLDVTSSDQLITEQSAAILYRLLNENRVCPSLRLDARELSGSIVKGHLCYGLHC